jgi:hypothetical protein
MTYLWDHLMADLIQLAPCQNCERCTWNAGPDCGKPDHAHCERCGHCIGRHVPAEMAHGWEIDWEEWADSETIEQHEKEAET